MTRLFLIACRHGQYAFVESLLACRTFDLSDGRAVTNACASGSASIVERILQAQEITSKLTRRPGSSSAFDLGNIGHVALHQAASNGHEKVVETLLASGAQADISDTVTGLTPLQAAAKNGHLQVVKALCTVPSQNMPRGRGMDAPHETTGMKALHYGAENGHDEVVSFLVKHRSGCDDQNSLGETALIKASQNGHTLVAKVLLEAGADPLVRRGEQYDVAFRSGRTLSYDESERRGLGRKQWAPLAKRTPLSIGYSPRSRKWP